jgi:hypothetical protein
MRVKFSRIIFLKKTVSGYLKISILLLLIFFAHSSFAQQVKPSATIDSTHYLIGDWIKVHLQADHASGVTVLWKNASDTGYGKFQKISESKLDTLKFSYGLSERKTIVLTTFDTSAHAIPCIPVYYKDQSGNIDTVYTDSIPVRILTIPVDTTLAIKPIKAPLGVPINWLDYLFYIITGLLIIAIAAYGYYYFTTKKKKEKVLAIKAIPKKSPQQIALEKLKQLDNEKVWQKDGDVKTYYVRLTDIIREYIEQVYNVPAMEETTDEIIAGLQYKKLPGDAFKKLNDLLTMADLVKFAKAKPIANDHITAMSDSVNFVTMTGTENTGEKEVSNVQ